MKFNLKLIHTNFVLLSFGVFSLACGSNAERTPSNLKVYIGDVGSIVDDPNDPVYHSTVAILATKPEGSTESLCSGTIIDSYYVLTAAHCVDYIFSGRTLEIGFGTHPSEEKRRRVTSIAFPYNEYNIDDFDGNGVDFALLAVDDPFMAPTHSIASLSHSLSPERSSKFVQAGYGYGGLDDQNPQAGDPPLGVLRKIGDASLYPAHPHQASLDRMIHVSNKTMAGIRGGDSGGPLYILDSNDKLVLQGVLSTGGPVGMRANSVGFYVASYSNVAFLKNWLLKAASSTNHLITSFVADDSSPRMLSPEFAGPMINIADYPQYLRKFCQRNPGWDLVSEVDSQRNVEICQPATKESCEQRSKIFGNELYWSNLENKCKVVPDNKEDCINFSDDGNGAGSSLEWNQQWKYCRLK